MLKMCECTGHLAGLQYRNVRVLVWSMREWSGFYNTGMCDCEFGQCASDLALTTPECASGLVFATLECASVVGPMCKCSGHNVRVIGYGRVEMCEYGDVQVR